MPLKNPFKKLIAARAAHGSIGGLLRSRHFTKEHRTLYPYFVRAISKKFIGAAGEVILAKPKIAHSEGDFRLRVWDKRRTALGEMEVRFRTDAAVCIEAVQGEKGKFSAQQRLFEERKLTWSDVLVERLLTTAQQSGFRYVFLVKPEKQFYLPNSPNKKNAAERLLKIKKKYGFQELPAPEILFSHKNPLLHNMEEYQWFYREGKGKYWVRVLS